MSVLMTGQERDRAKVDEKYTWNLADIYPDVAAWRAAKERVHGRGAAGSRLRRAGSASSPQALADALERRRASTRSCRGSTSTPACWRTRTRG